MMLPPFARLSGVVVLLCARTDGEVEGFGDFDFENEAQGEGEDKEGDEKEEGEGREEEEEGQEGEATEKPEPSHHEAGQEGAVLETAEIVQLQGAKFQGCNSSDLVEPREVKGHTVTNVALYVRKIFDEKAATDATLRVAHAPMVRQPMM